MQATALLIRLAWARMFRGRLRRSFVAATALLGTLLAVAVGRVDLAPTPASAASGEVPPAYGSLCWGETYALILLTLVVSASTIAEERKLGTWDALTLTSLSDREVVAGKLLGAMLPALLVIVTLLPTHLIAVMRGFVRPEVSACVHAIFAGVAATTGAIGLLVSALSGRTLNAVALGAAAVLFGWFGSLDALGQIPVIRPMAASAHPLRLISRLVEPEPSRTAPALSPFLIWSGAIFAASVLWAISVVRRPLGRARAWSGPLSSLNNRATLEMWDDPVLWRECRLPGGRRLSRVAWSMAVGLVVLIAVVRGGWTWSGAFRSLVDQFFGHYQILLAASALAVWLRSSVAIVDERTRGMLDPIRLAGIDAHALIRSKFAGILFGSAVPLAAILVVSLAGLAWQRGRLDDTRVWLGGAGLCGAGLIYLQMVAALCLCASALARSARVALTVGGAIFLGSYLGAALVPVFSFLLPDSLTTVLAAFSPPIFASVLMAHASGSPTFLSLAELSSVIGLEVVIGLMALGTATWRLRREGSPGRMPRSVSPLARERVAHA